MSAAEGAGREAERRRVDSRSAFIQKTALGWSEGHLSAPGDALLGLARALGQMRPPFPLLSWSSEARSGR